MAAPLAPPPTSATSVFSPEGDTRTMRPPLTSATSTEPSAMATGPSGKASPSATSSISTSAVPGQAKPHLADQAAHHLAGAAVIDAGDAVSVRRIQPDGRTLSIVVDEDGVGRRQVDEVL